MGVKVTYQGELEIVHPKKIFMDRDNARKLFWDTYDDMEEGDTAVINYYGFGGIGKSSLCHYLNDILRSGIRPVTNEKLISKSFVFSFEEIKNSCDKVEVLSGLANIFEKECGYNLTYFKYALYVYYRKKGLAVDAPEIKSLGNNSAFNIFLDALSFAPIVGGIGSAVIKNADMLVAEVKAFFMEHKNEILELDMKSEEEITNLLPSFLVKDLFHYLSKEKRPVVVFLDTYEHLQNYIHKNPAKASEMFFWSANGLIRRMPNVLWIIAGQQRLNWAEDSYRKYNDAFWMNEKAIKYEQLNELDGNSIEKWFKTLNVDDKQLIDFLIQKTKGVPIHVAGCIERYLFLKNKDKQPSITDFDMDYNELASRFIGGLNDEARDMIEMLACFEKWTYEDIHNMGKSYNLYEYLKLFSFIVEEGNGFRMHESVCDMIQKDSHLQNKKDCIQVLKEKAADYSLTATERKDCTYRKIKLQLQLIEAENNQEQKYRLVDAFFKENIGFIRDNINDDYCFTFVLEQMKKSIPENCVSDEYAYELVVYQAYYWSYAGNYERAKMYIQLIDTATNSHWWQFRNVSSNTEVLLRCAVAMYKGTENAYLEAIEQLNYISNCYVKINLLVGYAHVLMHEERYEEALEYCIKGMEILATMQVDTLRAGFECEIIIVQAEIKLELLAVGEALFLLRSLEKIIEQYRTAADQNALFWFARAYSMLSDLEESEEKGAEYAKKSLDMKEKLYKLNPNDVNRYNLAVAYRKNAEYLSMEDKNVITYYTKAMEAFEELYKAEKDEHYLKDWILTGWNAFQKTQTESFLIMCKRIMASEYKGQIITYIDTCKLDKAKQLLKDYRDIVREMALGGAYDNVSKEKEELVWINSKLAGVEYLLGNRGSAYQCWSYENADRKILTRSCKIEDIQAYVDSCARWVMFWIYEKESSEFSVSRRVFGIFRNGYELFVELSETIKKSIYVEEFYEIVAKYLNLLMEVIPVFELRDMDKANVLREQMEKIWSLLSDLKQNYFYN